MHNNFENAINNIKKNPNQSYIIAVDDLQTAKKFIAEIISNLEILINDYLIVKPEKESLKLSEVKKIQKKLSLKAQGKIALAAVLSAEKMTYDAGNSLLKIIEEPPKNCLILLFTQNIDKIIPTIISRCTKIHLREKNFSDIDKDKIQVFTEIIKKEKISRKFKIVEKIIVSETDIIKMLQSWLYLLRVDLTPQNQKYYQKIYRYMKRYSLGINKKLFLENLVLDLNS